MKNSALRLIVALITFAVGIALVTLWLGYKDAGHTRRAKTPCRLRARTPPPPAAASGAESPAGESLLPVLSYCELVGNPERYNGKVVRVRAALRMSIHGLFLSDVTCDRYEDYAAVAFDEPRGEELMDAFFGTDGPVRVGRGVVELIAVGRFYKV
ncbi:MAG TPA: hypothetical protein VF240_13750, partial [Pyrinomonadaceae bacterium]